MSTTRSLRNRSSRYSSPATFAANNETTPPVQQTIEVQRPENGVPQQSRLDTWVEPLVRHGVPSFEDTKGLERAGVLEQMQPLGTGPNQKLLQRLKVNYNGRPSLSARATPVYSEGIASPSIEPARLDIASPIDPELLLDAPPLVQQPAPAPPPLPPPPAAAAAAAAAVPPIQDMQQSMQEPIAQIPVSPPRGRPAKKEVEEMRYIPADGSSFFPPGIRSTPRPSRASPRNSSIQEHVREERMRGYLNQAIHQAHSEGNAKVAAGLQNVIGEAKNESRMLTALEAILQNKGNNVAPEHLHIFKHHIKKGIRKRQRISDRPAGMDQVPVPTQPQTVGYLSTWSTKKPSSTDDPAINSNSAQNTPLTLRTTQPESSIYTSPPKLELHSPSTLEIPATDLRTADTLPLADLPAASTPSKRRSSNASTTSTLSSAQSIELPTSRMVDSSREVASEGRATRSSAVQRQDPNQVASVIETHLPGTDLSQHPSIPPKPSYAGINTSNQPASKKIKLTLPLSEDEIKEIDGQRKFYESQTVQDYNYNPPTSVRLSNIRPELDDSQPFPQPAIREGPPPPVIHPNPLFEVSSPTSQGDFEAINGTGRKRSYDEVIADDQSSLSDAISVSQPIAPTNARHSIGASSTRASTPRAAKDLRTSKQRHPRVMISPQKPKNGASAAGTSGTARAGAGIDAATAANSPAEEQQENEDRCRSCGGSGFMVCCDSCPNSFHLDCLEPPISSVPVGHWDCPECEAQKKPKQEIQGLMATLIANVSDAYPRQYNLPPTVRDYFENVKTGEDGSYEEIPVPPTNKKGAARADHHGAMRPPNYKDMRDNKGNVRFCYRCGLTTGGDREMIPCDFCTNEWHLDCLDPPHATVPKRFIDGKAIGSWICPLHVENDYRTLSRAVGVAPGDLGRKPRLRRPKKAESMPLFAPLRQPNNGIIDVALDPEEPVINVKEVEMGSGVYRLPEESIKLDFLARARRDWYYDHAVPRARNLPATRFHIKSWLPDGARYGVHTSAVASQQWSEQDRFHSQASDLHSIESLDSYVQARAEAQVKLRSKTFVEQQTALNLVDLSNAQEPATAGANGTTKKNGITNTIVTNTDDAIDIDSLIDRLITDAPPEVADLVAETEEEQLFRLRGLIERRMKTIQAQKRSHGRAGKPKEMEQKVNGALGHDHGT